MPAVKWKFPAYYRYKDRLKGEEDAAVWLWARPSLLGWSPKLEWVLSPCTGNTEWPGDLWGVDETGELFILESKKLPLGRRPQDDPFGDLLLFHRNLGTKTHEFTRYDSLHKKWKDRYRCEIRFGSESGKRCWERRPKDCTKTILPNSSHRGALRRWKELVEDLIEPKILQGRYAQNIEDYLEQRRAQGNPPPHYCGLLLDPGLKEPTMPRGIDPLSYLLERRHTAITKLASLVELDHIHLFVAKADRTLGNRVKVSVKDCSASNPTQALRP